MFAAAPVAPAARPAPPQFRRSVLGRAALLVQLLAVVLGVAVLVAVVSLAEYERREVLEAAGDRGELMTRLLEERVTQTAETAALALRTLSESIVLQPTAEPARLQPLLSQSLLALPFLRSVAVLDLQGRVLASSLPSELGLQLALQQFGKLPPVGGDVLAQLLPGRGLVDLTAQVRRPRAAAVSMLPLLRRVRLPGGQELLLLAMINPDALANDQQLALSDDEGASILASYTGQLITATDQVSLAPGSSLAAHPVFGQWLPSREHGGYIGAGVRPGLQVVAFRVSRSRPLVVLVEQSREAVLRNWRATLPWLAALSLASMLLILAATAAVMRALHAREESRRALDRAHEQVALRERELSVLLKSVQELIFRTDADGAITFVNARWGAVSQEGPEQAIGRHLRDIVVPAEQERVAALFNLDDRAGVRSAEVSVHAADGRLRRFSVAVVPLHRQGEIVGFAGSAVDVTERLIVEQKLQRQLAFTGLLLEMSPLPVSVFDARGRYVTVNQAWEDFTGRQRADIIGTEVGHFMRREEAALHAARDAELMAEGGRLRYETQLFHRDGSRRDMLVTKVLVPDEQGGAAGILCTLMDVSEFRDAERATREARDVAEEASRAKSEFVANMSHELRTPLQSILGFSELGLTRGRDSPKLAGMFGDIHASGQRMLALVNDLLDVAKIESAVGTFDLERCDLRGLVHSVVQELDPLMARRRLRLRLQLSEEPLTAKVDPLRFQQVIRNVMANAIKFSPEEGPLEVEGRITPQGEICLSVADRGPGIPASELESIFEAFVQSSKTKDGAGGTGLGLAICRKIIDIHGGRISAANRPEGGSIFELYLPFRGTPDTRLGEP